jgi:hypothetical protein
METNPRDLVFGLIEGYLGNSLAGQSAIDAGHRVLPPDVLPDLENVLSDRRISYRDGVLIQLGYGIAAPSLDLTKRPEGARGMAQQLGEFLAARHITAVKDAYQNIAKNSDVLTRNNVPAFDRLLVWATGATLEQREAALRLACAVVAATARPVLPMPSINRSALTFARFVDLLHALLASPSGGAFEQFTIAALLHCVVANHGEGRARVETKNLNASDRSSYAAGDVQLVAGSRVLEAFEVTANDWRTKVGAASKTIRDNDLSRIHVIAARPESDRAAASAALRALAEDVSVLDARQVVEVLAALLTRPQRAEALRRLYEYLDRYQPDTERVNLFVRHLMRADLVESTSD